MTSAPTLAAYPLQPIGLVHSCYKEKFGIPRQPGIARSAQAEIELLPPFNRPEMVKGLEGYSHIWLVFWFHETAEQGWSPTVRPPRLGGNRRLGVFATRSTFRPNPIGLSCVKLESIDYNNGVRLRVSGIDVMQDTPVLDIKPYIPFSDCQPTATASWVPAEPPRLPVIFLPELCPAPPLRQLIEDTLAHDPRPAYQADDQREYGIRIHDCNVRFRIQQQQVFVLAIEPV